MFVFCLFSCCSFTLLSSNGHQVQSRESRFGHTRLWCLVYSGCLSDLQIDSDPFSTVQHSLSESTLLKLVYIQYTASRSLRGHVSHTSLLPSAGTYSNEERSSGGRTGSPSSPTAALLLRELTFQQQLHSQLLKKSCSTTVLSIWRTKWALQLSSSENGNIFSFFQSTFPLDSWGEHHPRINAGTIRDPCWVWPPSTDLSSLVSAERAWDLPAADDWLSAVPAGSNLERS